ncbi:hydroxymethylbilane synthase [Paenibacillus sp. DMB20]|uniref:hydroxymethylbilane synthase n=1 Tax=Paenibacillus sp. DMB20 TaxID=1642570 RepID=UPI000627D503|nr:hydroxymethylbilane synthase [Paenibacillus sp. DMB20]KKO51324.1 porphobilinogen deaminase [Paenibacillus sp. DMB20]KKO51842.1 porphobilinogen deaminase [Paenibacillus sp. DMB20]
MRTIVVGSRQSALALTQTGQVIDDLTRLAKENGFDYRFEVKKIVTKGDRILDVTLSKVGGKGLFVKEIEQAMIDGEIDMAVHSMKDMPSFLPEGLTTGAVPRRKDPRDCLISMEADSLDKLPQGAKVGTSSLRRSSQLKAYRPDLTVEWIRGNIDSRLRKLESGEYQAIILAAAGLQRMGWEDRITSYLPVETCLPAVGQGALGIECRENDAELLRLLSLYNDEDTARTVAAERKYLNELNGGCQVPIGAYAVLAEAPTGHSHEGQKIIRLTGMVGSPDGDRILKKSAEGMDPDRLGIQVAEQLKAMGAEEILAQVRG